jgi:hypothetical protein
MVAHSPRFIYRQFQNPFGPRRQIKLGGGCPGGGTCQPLDQFYNTALFCAQVMQHARSHTFFFADQSQKQMFGTDGIMLETFGFFLG